jgi:hypothetical protein
MQKTTKLDSIGLVSCANKYGTYGVTQDFFWSFRLHFPVIDGLENMG